MHSLVPCDATVDGQFANQTLASVVRWLYREQGLSWNQARDLIRHGKVQVDGALVFDDVQRLTAGQRVAVQPSALRRQIAPIDQDRLLFVDADLVVVSKPAGIESVPFEPSSTTRRPVAAKAPPNRSSDTLIDRVVSALRERGGHRTQVRQGPHQPPLGIVQRLDRDTTGVLVFTRTRAAREGLEAQFREHSVERRYLALTYGVVQNATFHTQIVPNRGDGLRGSLSPQAGKIPDNARDAITHVHAEERLPGGYTLVSCRLETGRQHQIRIHLAEAGHPLLGEPIYGREFHEAELALQLASRPMLHAATLGFRHPVTGKRMRFEEPLPSDFAELLQRLRQRQPLT